MSETQQEKVSLPELDVTDDDKGKTDTRLNSEETFVLQSLLDEIHCRERHRNKELVRAEQAEAALAEERAAHEVTRKIAHDLWNQGGRLRTNLNHSLNIHPENWDEEGLKQRLAEWDSAAERYFDLAINPIEAARKAAGESK